MTIGDLLLRLKAIVSRRQMEHELDEELQTHLELQTRKHLAAGSSMEEAEAKARREFGAVELTKENCRDARRVNVVENLFQDFRYAFRGLRREPALTLIALFTLAICIAANTTVFSIMNSVMLRPLPYPAEERLYWLSERMGMNQAEAAIGADYYGLREENRVFEDMAAYSPRTFNLIGVERPEQLDAAQVSPSFFKVLATQPLLGRYLAESEQGLKAPDVIVVSYRFWRSHMASDPRVLGKAISLDGLPQTVIGVMPQGFDYPKGTQLWKPLPMDEASQRPRRVDRPMRIVSILARLKQGVTEQQLHTELDRLTHSIYQEYPQEFASSGFLRGMQILAVPLHRQMVGDLRPSLLVLSGAVALVLLVACANLANLLLARAATRQRELAVRMALGSGRARIVKQVLTESLALALPGGIVGVSIACIVVKVLNAWKPLVLQNYPPLSVDVNTLAFSFGLTFLTALIFGMAPAMTAARISIQDALKSAGPMQTSGRTATRMRRMLVVAELGVSLVLLISAGLLGRSFVKLATTELGFPAANLLTLRFNLTGSRYATAQSQMQFYDEVLERVKQLPQVKQAAFSTDLPLSGDVRFYSGAQFEVAGRPLPMAQWPLAGISVVSRDFFKTLGIPLRDGRVFDSRDNSGSPYDIVVNEAFAKRLFPGEDPLNHRILMGPNNAVNWRIVGVVGSIRAGQLGAEPSPLIYRCLCQGGSSELSRTGLLVRTAGDPHGTVHAIESQIYSVDRNEPVFDIKTMDERLTDSLAPQRFHLLLIGIFTVIAVVLSAVGVNGVMSYLVTQRRREIGIRIAMGAQLEHVFRLVMGESVTLAMLAVVVGLVGARGSIRFLHSMLYGVTAMDAVTFTIMPVVLVAIAVAASFVPTMKALQTDPTVALREE